ncbi:MAG: hypothetical protein J3K34DRAFT_471773 [Monoraphidium minutum]|nr:MAG: hypothetical protein J3K34DRAFT_471773 [Monoraphidium minutum]
MEGKRKRTAARPRGEDFVTDWDADWSDGGKPKKAKAASASKKAAAAQQAGGGGGGGGGAAGGGGGAVDFSRLDTDALQKYRNLFQLPLAGGGDAKTDLVATVSAHFCRQQVDEDETLLRFVVALRRQSPMGLHLGPGARDKRLPQPQ